MTRRLIVLVLLLAVALPIHAQADRLQVVASFNILADVVQNVAGDAADVTALIPLGADPHSFTPAPSNLAVLSEADVVFVSGAHFEEGLLESIESVVDPAKLVTASACVEILPFGGAEAHDDAETHVEPTPAADDALAQRCADHAAQLDADHEHGALEPLGRLYALECGEHAHEGEADHDGEEEGCDPHVWFDPHNVAYWTLQIRDALSAADPANSDVYASNAAVYLEQLESLEAELHAMIETIPPERRVLVTDHDVLAYLANAYDFRIVGLVVPSVSTLAEPSAVQVAALIDTIRAEGVTAVFAGTTVSPALAQQVADEAGAQFYSLHTESLSDADGAAATYLDYMRYNVETIVAALS